MELAQAPWLTNLFSANHLPQLLRAGAVVLLAMVLSPWLKRGLRRLLLSHLGEGATLLSQRLVGYLVFGVTVGWALRELGFDLNVLMGTAGILGVALSFSSQTSIAQLVSGLFIIWEKPFSIGDMINVEGTIGEVLGIDPLSVKLRTCDNLYVRIPNETILKGRVSNMSRFPIRRYDIELGVPFSADIERVRLALASVASRNPLCLEDPQPLFILLGFGDSNLRLQFSVWSKRENFLELKNSICIDIKHVFDSEGIALPYPHRTLVAAPGTFHVEVRPPPSS